MTSDDDDILTAPVPEPDAEPSAAERAHARAFAELIDKMGSGRTPPPAMSADDRALLEVATVIRAASGGLELAPSRARALVEASLRQAVDGRASPSSSATPIASARSRRRLVPWAIAATSTLVAAAAVLVLWLRAPHVQQLPTAETPISWRSRSADPLIGEIKSAHAADASARIDTIFADRLAGYRDRRLSRGGRP